VRPPNLLTACGSHLRQLDRKQRIVVTAALHPWQADPLVGAPTAVADADADAVRLLDTVELPLAETDPDAAAVALCSGGGRGKGHTVPRWSVARVHGELNRPTAVLGCASVPGC
jgi:hypothetical protein